MSRPLRVEFPGAVYHVIARGNERREIFREDGDREFYLRRLAHYRERLGFQVSAYCLMTNHLHLAIAVGKAPPADSPMAQPQRLPASIGGPPAVDGE
jgi:putative transposase